MRARGGRASSVRKRRPLFRNRLRRRLGHAMGRVRHSQTCVICALCAPLGADFAAGVGHPVRAGAPWVGFSGLEVLRDHALDDMPSPMVSETRFTPQIPGTLVCRTHKLHAGIFRKHMPHDAEPDMKSLIHHHAAFDS